MGYSFSLIQRAALNVQIFINFSKTQFTSVAHYRGFPGGSGVKNLPIMQETRVWSLGHEDPLKEEVETVSRILAWEIPWTEEPGGLQSMGPQRVGYDWAAKQQQ